MIDCKKLTIEYAFKHGWWRELIKDIPVYKSYEDIPLDDRSEDGKGHVICGDGYYGFRDSKKFVVLIENKEYGSIRGKIKEDIVLDTVFRAAIAMSPDEELTKEYQHWLGFVEQGIKDGFAKENKIWEEASIDLEEKYQAAKKKRDDYVEEQSKKGNTVIHTYLSK